MNCQADIEQLAQAKLSEAECLLNNGFYDGAFYLSGYVVELLLKAKVCKTLGIGDFFLFDKIKSKEAYRPYKSHDYTQLLVLSGLYSEFEAKLIADITFKAHWSVISVWEEGSRYLTGQSQQSVQDFITSIKEISQWIQSHL